MKTLELRCGCGRRQSFKGRNADEVMVDIDASGWTDSKGGGKGWMPGTCDDCHLAASFERESATVDGMKEGK
jgi:hypothetical protein